MSDELDVKFGASIEGLVAGAAAAANAVDGFAHRVEESLAPLVKMQAAMGKLSEAFVAAFAVERVLSAIESVLAFGEAMEIASKATGIEVEELSRLAYAANLNNVNFDQLQTAMQRFSRAIQEGATGSGTAAKAFNALGISQEFVRANSNNVQAILRKVADAYAATADGANKLAVTAALFGRGSREFVAFLNEGSAGLAKMAQESDELGNTLSGSTARKLSEAENDTKRFNAAIGALWREIVVDVLPAFTALVNGLTAVAAGFRNAFGAPEASRQLTEAQARAKDLTEQIEAMKKAAGTWSFNPNSLAALEARLAQLNARIAVLKQTVASETQGEWQGPVKPDVKPLGDSDASAFDLAKIRWEEQLAAQGQFFRDMNAQELAYWKGQLKSEDANSAEQVKIRQRIFDLEKTMATDNYGRQRAALEQQLTTARDDGAERIRIAQLEVDQAASAYGRGTVEFIAAETRKIQVVRQVEDEIRNIRVGQIESSERIAELQAQLDIENTQSKRKTWELSADEAAAIEIESANKLFAIKLQALEDERALYTLGTKEYADRSNRIEELELQHQIAIAQIQHRATESNAKDWTSYLKNLQTQFAQTFTGLINGTLTWQAAMRNVFNNLLNKFIEFGLEMVAKWIGFEALKTAASEAWHALMVALGFASEASAVAVSKVGAAAQILAAAAVAGANAFAATAAIPIVGPGLAPAAGAAAYAGAASFAATLPAGFKLGGDVPYDMPALLHAREMVLPADLADGMRSIIQSGHAGGGGGNTYNIQAWDSRDVDRFLRSHKGSVARAARAAHRDGNPATRGR